MMIPGKIQIVILDVRLNEKNSIDFKDSVTAYLVDTYGLNEMQAAIAYHWADIEESEFESIFFKAIKYADFARSILRNK
jgi:hypothetical protein